jgi:hypothetical protein
MERIYVASSSIRSIGYSPTEAILEIEFLKGGIYQYYDVPQFEFDNLMDAESKGKHAIQNIYKVYRYARIG